MYILLIEDNKDFRDGLKEYLSLEGHHVDAVEFGRDGLLLGQQNNYDYIFSDLDLPDLNGWTVTKLIRKKNSTSRIYMMSAMTAALDVRQSRGDITWLDGIIKKPFKAQKIVELLK